MAGQVAPSEWVATVKMLTESGSDCAARSTNKVIGIPPSTARRPRERWKRMACHDVADLRLIVDADTATTVHTDLAGTPHSAPLGRLFLREHLRGQVPAEVLQTVELLTTELVSNVVVHARTAIRLGVSWDERSLLVTVQDREPAGPVERHRHGLDHERETGRGLQIIASLADDFGWSKLPHTVGKVMWFALALPKAAPAVFAAPIPRRQPPGVSSPFS